LRGLILELAEEIGGRRVTRAPLGNMESRAIAQSCAPLPGDPLSLPRWRRTTALSEAVQTTDRSQPNLAFPATSKLAGIPPRDGGRDALRIVGAAVLNRQRRRRGTIASSKVDFLFAWHAPNFAKNRTQPECAIPGLTRSGRARRVSSGSVVRRAAATAALRQFVSPTCLAVLM
jgi:hypothetical protein